MHAIRYNDVQVLQVLLQHGASVQIKNKNGKNVVYIRIELEQTIDIQ